MILLFIEKGSILVKNYSDERIGDDKQFSVNISINALILSIDRLLFWNI